MSFFSPAARMPRRVAQLFFGLSAFGVGNALMLRSRLGMDPWNVFHQGVATHVPLSLGAIIVITSFVVMLMWIPLEQRPGFGTLANAVWIGLATDAALWVIPDIDSLALRIVANLAGIAIIGWCVAAYIGAHLGPGPRDGLMTGLHRVTGRSIRLVRTLIEVSVLIVGVLLGGTFGPGTIIFALAVGPIVQFFLPRTQVRMRRSYAGRSAGGTTAGG